MPAYLKPGARAKIWLTADANENPRPEFYTRALTKAETIELGDSLDAIYEGVENTKDLMDKAYGLLAKYVDGWVNLPKDFDLDKLAYAEVRELLAKVLHSQSLTFDEKKD